MDHSGHRSRLKQRFCEQGLDGFNQINALELMLFYAIPRVDTNPIAHRLLNRFGSISNVVEAPMEELLRVEGITENTAVLLRLFLSFTRYYLADKDKAIGQITDFQTAINMVLPLFVGRTDETALAIMLDAKGKILKVDILSAGTKDATPITGRKVAELALLCGAYRVLLAHNHPGGFALPSQEDYDATADVERALNALHIHLLDHFIVADGDCVSLRQSGYKSQ